VFHAGDECFRLACAKGWLALYIPHNVLGVILRKRTALIRRYAIVREAVGDYLQVIPEAALRCVDELIGSPSVRRQYSQERFSLLTTATHIR
jgi:hypothetical protein